MTGIETEESDAPPNRADLSPSDVAEREALGAALDKPLSAAARRALAEAQARRAQSPAAELSVGEQGGPVGLEPTRFGDWERKGLAVDF